MSIAVGPPPKGVKVALGAFAVVFLLDIAGAVIDFQPRDAGRLTVTAIFIYYLSKGHPLAHQWAVVLGAITGTLSAIGLLALPSMGAPGWLVALGFAQVAAVFTAIAALSTSQVRAWFDLRCPKCGSYKVKGASFLFNKLKCRQCKHAWNLRERLSDPSVFD